MNIAEMPGTLSLPGVKDTMPNPGAIQASNSAA